MTNVTVFGGTGYAGANITAQTAARGNHVTVVSRTAPAQPLEGVTYIQGSLGPDTAQTIAGADVVVAALSPRGDNAGRLGAAYRQLAADAAAQGVRLIVIGGFGSLRPAPDAPRFADGDIPAEFAAEAKEMDGFREWLSTDAPADLSWTFVSPAGEFGSYAPGEATGTYRLGGEVALFDENGTSAVSGADFGLAVADLIDSGEHVREHVSVAY